MQASISRALPWRRRHRPDRQGIRLAWTTAAPTGAAEQMLVTILAETGPLERDQLVDRLATAILTAERRQPQAALLDIGLWGPAMAQVEAERVIERSRGRLLVEMA
jgi:hypothetical protein